MTEAGGRGTRYVDDARRYRLDSRIATGGMGEVWRGTDTVLDREVAVKLLKDEYADNPTFRSRFETEARHAAALHHPGVAAVFDFGEAETADGSDAQRPYLVMELVNGQPLSALLLPDTPLDADVTRDLLAQAADALGAAHAASIVHRDVKPANLLVTPDRTVKITDFGIARAAEGIALTETGQVMGTPQYLSPEQAQGGTATPASDVYSLGVVAFECLAGRRPFVAETPIATALAHLRDPVPELPPEVPADLAAVVRRSLAKSPEDRFPDGDAFAAALRDPAGAVAAAGAAGAAGAAAGAAALAADDASAADQTRIIAGAGAVPPPLATAAPPGTPATPAAAPAAASSAGGSDRRRVPWAWILLALLLIAAVIAVAVLATTGDETPTRPDRPTTSQGPGDDKEPSETPEETSEPSPEPSETQEPSPEPTTESPTETAPTETPTEEPTPTEPTETPTEEPSETPSESPAAEESPDSTSPRSTPTAAEGSLPQEEDG